MSYKKYYQSDQYMQSFMNMISYDFFNGGNDPDHYFKRAKNLLKVCRLPDNKLKIILVGGTSGKGSTANTLHKILSLAGHRTGLYLSPHTTTAAERIKINDKLIAAVDFARLTEKLKPFWEKAAHDKWGAPSYFEIFLTLALEYFKKEKCEYAVLEIGCGGQHDAVNAVPKVLLSILTNVSLDHTLILGDTLEKIAHEKIGIARKNSLLFSAESKKKIKEIFQRHCQKNNCKLIFLPDKTNSNQKLASTVARHLKIEEKHIEKGLQAAKLPCRFETVQHKPRVILDGAHNPAKIKYLAKNLTKLQYNDLFLVMGLTAAKNPLQVFKDLIPLADSICCTRFTMPFRKVLPPFELKKALQKKLRKPIFSYLDPNEALRAALKKARQTDLVLVTGSLYLCGELRKNWISEESILKNRDSFAK